MRTLKAFVSAIVLAMAIGCAPALSAETAATSPGDSSSPPATSSTVAPSSRRPGMMEGMMDGICPMTVPGTTVAVREVEGGIALAFTTSTGDVSELRRRVHRMADMHETGCGMMPGHTTMMAGGKIYGGMMDSTTASADDVDHGARLVLKPSDLDELDSFRQLIRACAARMQQGTCPTMMPSQ